MQKSTKAALVRKAMYATAMDTGEPVEQEGAGFIQADAALAKLAPEQPEPGWFPELPRVAFGNFGDGTLRETRERGSCVITVGRERRDFGVFRLKGGS